MSFALEVLKKELTKQNKLNEKIKEEPFALLIKTRKEAISLALTTSQATCKKERIKITTKLKQLAKNEDEILKKIKYQATPKYTEDRLKIMQNISDLETMITHIQYSEGLKKI